MQRPDPCSCPFNCSPCLSLATRCYREALRIWPGRCSPTRTTKISLHGVLGAHQSVNAPTRLRCYSLQHGTLRDNAMKWPSEWASSEAPNPTPEARPQMHASFPQEKQRGRGRHTDETAVNALTQRCAPLFTFWGPGGSRGECERTKTKGLLHVAPSPSPPCSPSAPGTRFRIRLCQ
jgi:hypothetical protein